MKPNLARKQWITRRTAAVFLFVSLIGLLALGLALEHRPAWYTPAVLDSTGVQSARLDATRAADLFGDQLVHGKPFEIVLSDEILNAWLAALPQIWPDAARAIPPELHDLAIRFDAGMLRVGAMYDVGGWRAIVSVAIVASLSNDGTTIDLRLADRACGSVSLPHVLAARFLDPLLRANVPTNRKLAALEPAKTSTHSNSSPGGESDSASSRPDDKESSIHGAKSVDQLFRGVRFRNRFVWPNGKRPFRIVSFTITPGELRLRIEALTSR